MRRGFTLVEILVVISIIGVLYLVVFGSISTSKARSRDDKRVSDVKEIQLALTQFNDACQGYPSTITASGACPGGGPYTFGDFIKYIPVDPSSGASYHYYSPAPGVSFRSFCLGATLEVKSPSLQNDNADCDTDATCTGTKCYSVKSP